MRKPENGQPAEAEGFHANRRPMGSRCHYEEAFLPPERVKRLCQEQQKPLFCAAQVVVTHRLMQERRWRQADLARHSGLKRGMVSLVLRVESFPGSYFWVAVVRCFGLKMSAFDGMAEDWMEAENPIS